MSSVSLACGSLSARRAWIEKISGSMMVHGDLVALRKESVDRKDLQAHQTCLAVPSLSARGAWIEKLYSW